MSQSRFSIVLVGVSALLRRPLVSRLRPADGERSPWVVFAARGDLPFRRLPLGGLVLPPPASGLPSASWPSGSRLPLFGTRRFGDCRSAGWSSDSRLPLFGTHRFEVALGGLVFPLGELAFGFTAFAFRHAPLRRLPLGEFVLPSSALEIALGGLTFGLTASAFRHAVLRRLPSAGWFFRLPLRSCRSAGWPSGSPLPLFGMHRFAPPRRRSEDRRSTTTRQLFHFKTLIPTC